MADTKTHYEILSVPAQADAATIKRAYYAKMRQYHPDRLMAERSQLEARGDHAGLRAIDYRLEDAKRQTQLLNAAYAVLSDPEQRQRYDRQQAQAAAERAKAAYNPAHEPRTSQTHRRPHARPGAPPKPQEDQFPMILAVIFLVALVFTLFGLSGFLRAGAPAPRSSTIMLTQTRLYIPAGSTDATATSRANLPAPTPRTAQSYTNSGDSLFDMGLYHYAVDQYTLALSGNPDDVALYLKRGRAYAADGQIEEARDDFDRAARLAPTLAEVYRVRGLFHYERWQQSRAAAAARAAQADLQLYLQMGGDAADPLVAAALQALP